MHSGMSIQTLFDELGSGQVSALIGLLIGLVQALTQVQDQTISFVPKIAAMTLALGVCLPWIIQYLVDYSQELITNIPRLVMGG